MSDTKLSLLMYSLNEYYQKFPEHINEIAGIINQKGVVSLRVLDWFITNFSKKNKTFIEIDSGKVDVYSSYKLMLKSFSKKAFDPFCRKGKMQFYYTDTDFLITSCGQLCFFRWCFENGIIDYVVDNLEIIEKDMKDSLGNNTPKTKRKSLSIPSSRSVSRQNVKYKIEF